MTRTTHVTAHNRSSPYNPGAALKRIEIITPRSMQPEPTLAPTPPSRPVVNAGRAWPRNNAGIADHYFIFFHKLFKHSPLLFL